MGIFTTNPVLDMLKNDHKKVQELFEQFKAADDSRSKSRLVVEAIRELEIHSKLEETLIYPAIREKIDQDDVMDEALEEHHVAHVLIKELKRIRERFTIRSQVHGSRRKYQTSCEGRRRDDVSSSRRGRY